MFDDEWSTGMEFRMTKPRKLNPIVVAVENATSELNDLLNAIGLRISLLQHQVEAAAFEAEIARLAGLVEKATNRVRLLDEYVRAEALVASMRPDRAKRPPKISRADDLDVVADRKPRTALLIADPAGENSAIKESLERSGCTVVVAESSAAGMSMLQSNQHFDHILCDSAFITESKLTAELTRAAPESRVYVLQRSPMSDRIADPVD
jgi:PleD family two-component response regulator